MEPGMDEPELFVGITEGKIVPARGPFNFGWDPIFEPEGYDKTYAELDRDTKNKISHRYKASELFIKYLESKQNKK
jgi:inosine triphosphate pyrophosphatase